MPGQLCFLFWNDRFPGMGIDREEILFSKTREVGTFENEILSIFCRPGSEERIREKLTLALSKLFTVSPCL